MLGSRLETDDKGLREKALLCYICAGNVNKLVDCWLVLPLQFMYDGRRETDKQKQRDKL